MSDAERNWESKWDIGHLSVFSIFLSMKRANLREFYSLKVLQPCPETLTTRTKSSHHLPTFHNAAVEKNGISMRSDDISFFIKLNLQIA